MTHKLYRLGIKVQYVCQISYILIILPDTLSWTNVVPLPALLIAVNVYVPESIAPISVMVREVRSGENVCRVPLSMTTVSAVSLMKRNSHVMSLGETGGLEFMTRKDKVTVWPSVA